MDFGGNLDRLMKAADITNSKLSRETGISDVQIGTWRKSGNLPTLENAVKLADYFEVPLDELIGRIPPKMNAALKKKDSVNDLIDSAEASGMVIELTQDRLEALLFSQGFEPKLREYILRVLKTIQE